MTRIIFTVALIFIAYITKGFAQCPEKNGRFPVSGQCDAYIECKDGVAEEKLCPDGLLFNDKLSPFAYPCQYPIDVSCENRGKTQPPQPTEDCPHQFGYYRLGDASNCGQFMNCASGKGFVFDCPEGLAFNQETYKCDWPDQVPDCDAESFLGFQCPQVAKSNLLGDEETRFFRSNNDCQHYFICLKGRPRMFNCGEGMAFNELINACDGIENVTGCASGPTPFKATQLPTRFDERFGGRQQMLQQQRSQQQRPQQQRPQQQRPQQQRPQQQQRVQPAHPRFGFCIDYQECPEKNGKFPIPGQCDAYIECIDGIAEEKLCPDGLMFNEVLSPKGKCQYAPSVNCTNRLKLQPPQSTEKCPRQFGFYTIGDPAHCSQYMNCAHGIGKITSCPEGLAFNKNTYRCDWPDQVDDCNAEEYLGFTCPPVEKIQSLDNEKENKTDDLRYYRHPNSCKRYFVCVNGKPRLYNCGKYLIFNEKTNLCDYYKNVPECRKVLKKIVPL